MVDRTPNFSLLLGTELVSVTGCTPGSERVSFKLADGREFVLWHIQDCCEGVEVEEVHGDPSKLQGLVVEAEEVSGYIGPVVEPDDSYTWTFYKIGTSNGESVTIRWLGQSNGYYSEEVYFDEASQTW